MNTQEFLKNVEQIGTRTTYTCPECNGSIWQIGKEEPLRFRCHIGHSFTANIFLSEQTQNVENALWSAVRAMEEKVTFSRCLRRLGAVGRRRRSAILRKTRDISREKNYSSQIGWQCGSRTILSGQLVVFFQDECHLLWGDVCGYVWGSKCERIEVPVVNERCKQTYYGAINLLSQECLIQACEKGNSESTIACLEYLLS